jgi:hypothetical protein
VDGPPADAIGKFKRARLCSGLDSLDAEFSLKVHGRIIFEFGLSQMKNI